MLHRFKIIFIVGIMAALAAAASAVPVVPPYPTSFWINGTLTGAPTLEGFKAYFFSVSGDYQAQFAMDVSAIDGKFHINAMDDLGMLPLVTGTTYYFGVENKVVGATSYGINETELTFTAQDLANGYKDLDAAMTTLVEQPPDRTDESGGESASDGTCFQPPRGVHG